MMCLPTAKESGITGRLKQDQTLKRKARGTRCPAEGPNSRRAYRAERPEHELKPKTDIECA